MSTTKKIMTNFNAKKYMLTVLRYYQFIIIDVTKI